MTDATLEFRALSASKRSLVVAAFAPEAGAQHVAKACKASAQERGDDAHRGGGIRNGSGAGSVRAWCPGYCIAAVKRRLAAMPGPSASLLAKPRCAEVSQIITFDSTLLANMMFLNMTG